MTETIYSVRGRVDVIGKDITSTMAEIEKEVRRVAETAAGRGLVIHVLVETAGGSPTFEDVLNGAYRRR